MNMYSRKVAVAALLSATVLILWSLCLPGCSYKPTNELTANSAPVVWFVNVPPENNQSSTNPIINWVGQDQDGQVVTFRYIVYREDTITNVFGGIIPLDSSEIQSFLDGYLMAMSDTFWTYLDVQPDIGDPKTSNIIPMSAELSDPVNSFVRQILFVQAFDEQGLASQIVFRAFLRNDNPPDTRTLGFLGGPFINSPFADGGIGGIRMRWQGSDVVDYPTDPPPFEFEWRLYGPYYSDTLAIVPGSDSAWEHVQDNFIKPVFVTRDAQIFRLGEGEIYISCDTTPVPDGDSVIQLETCDTLIIDTITVNNIFGALDTILDIDDPDFAGNSRYNRIAVHSHDDIDGDEWVNEDRDSIYDVFREEPTDTTQEQYFVFWVRSRDDATVPDLTPTFETFSVIDTRYERDIGVLDAQVSFSVNARIKDSAKAYWVRAIDAWSSSEGLAINYVDTIDYITVSTAQGIGVSLRQMLAHKMLVVVNDNPFPGMMRSSGFSGPLFTAVNAGVSVWMLGRAHIFGQEASAPFVPCYFEALAPDLRFFLEFYFGLECEAYSGWEWFTLRNLIIPGLPALRIEDFVGTLSLDYDKWPDVSVDTALLHSRYEWRGHFSWVDSIAALPEVDWFVRSQGSQAMFLYKSKYGAKHFLNDPDFDFQGRPVAHRLNRGLFKTVYWKFTPYAMEEGPMQITFNNVMNWLYDPDLSSPPAGQRFRDAEVPASLADIREMNQRLMEERAMRDPKLARRIQEEK